MEMRKEKKSRVQQTLTRWRKDVVSFYNISVKVELGLFSSFDSIVHLPCSISESSLGSSEQLPDSDWELDENGQRSGHSHIAATLGSEASLDEDQVSYRDSLDLSSQGGTHTDPEQEAEQDPENPESADPPMLPDSEPPEEEPGTEQDLSVSLAELNVNQSNNNLPCSPMVNLLGLPVAPLCNRKLILTRNRSSGPEFV